MNRINAIHAFFMSFSIAFYLISLIFVWSVER
uniref:Uncharacterized protein n=1 Tax=Dulem virus 29 TaxID=3145747 RepID=A0AAU8AUZ0_9CAUD